MYVCVCVSQAVMAHVHRLLRHGVAPQDIGIITPYNAQVRVPEDAQVYADPVYAVSMA
jgi:hypothetical protein